MTDATLSVGGSLFVLARGGFHSLTQVCLKWSLLCMCLFVYVYIDTLAC